MRFLCGCCCSSVLQFAPELDGIFTIKAQILALKPFLSGKGVFDLLTNCFAKSLVDVVPHTDGMGAVASWFKWNLKKNRLFHIKYDT